MIKKGELNPVISMALLLLVITIFVIGISKIFNYEEPERVIIYTNIDRLDYECELLNEGSAMERFICLRDVCISYNNTSYCFEDKLVLGVEDEIRGE